MSHMHEKNMYAFLLITATLGMLLVLKIQSTRGFGDDTVAKVVEGYTLAADFNKKTNELELETQSSDASDVENRHDEDYFSYDDETPPRSDVASYHQSFNRPPNFIVSQRSVFAVGFITFLILLSSLQSSIMLMNSATTATTQRSTLLGGVVQSLGRRRKRSAEN